MTPEDRYLVAASMARIELAVAATLPVFDEMAACAKVADAYGVALAALLVRESMEVYLAEMKRFAASLDS